MDIEHKIKRSQKWRIKVSTKMKNRMSSEGDNEALVRLVVHLSIGPRRSTAGRESQSIRCQKRGY